MERARPGVLERNNTNIRKIHSAALLILTATLTNFSIAFFATEKRKCRKSYNEHI